MIKKTLSLYTGWRNNVLFAVWAIAAFCIFSDADDVLLFLLVKLAGFALVFAGMRLYRHWNGKGLLKELNDYCKEED